MESRLNRGASELPIETGLRPISDTAEPRLYPERLLERLPDITHNFSASGHLDRAVPLKSYCTGLLLPSTGVKSASNAKKSLRGFKGASGLELDSLVRRQGISTEESDARAHASARNQTGSEEETSPCKSPYIEEIRL